MQRQSYENAIDRLHLAPWVDWFEKEYLSSETLPSMQLLTEGFRQMAFLQWTMLCQIAGVYQVWTQESVAALRAALVAMNATRIVEVGAGDGRLTRALVAGMPWTLIAQDDGSWARDGKPSATPVHPLCRDSIPDTLATIRPDTVIVSWMPPETDWTPLFRACPTVRQYLVIGEGPMGCTGTKEVFDPPAPWQMTTVPDFAVGARGRTDLFSIEGSRTNAFLFARP